MTRYEQIQKELLQRPRKWLVTGAAGFIGLNITKKLLELNQEVWGLDNLLLGKMERVEEMLLQISKPRSSRFHFTQGDIRDSALCDKLCHGIDFVLHQAALGSIPRSLENPVATHDHNVNGFLNILQACRNQKIHKLVYASSSSVYGDSPILPRTEPYIGQALSPYAVTKQINESYARVFHRCYQSPCIGLRYFNVFGPWQNPQGVYAAVIPRWILAFLENTPITIFGDGKTTRDFCFVDNIVQANLLAALVKNIEDYEIFNVAGGQRTSLIELFSLIRQGLSKFKSDFIKKEICFAEFRKGDVPHSFADISKISSRLDYQPTHSFQDGLDLTIQWFLKKTTR